MPFGVELPENLGQETKSEESVETREVSGQQDATIIGDDAKKVSTESAKPELTLTDLDKLERFRFEGRELTPKELKSAMLRHEDYTRKTQELSQSRKYADNFAVDLKRVQEDPNLLEQFKRVYPREYFEVAQKLLASVAPQVPGQANPNQLPPEFTKKLEGLEGRLSEWENSQKNAEIEQLQSWLNNQFESLGKKYPHAIEDSVTMQADYLSKNGTKITESVLDKLFKASHEKMKERTDKLYLSQANKQLGANKKSKDVGSGGGIPSSAPKGAKTLKDATKMFLEDIENGRR